MSIPTSIPTLFCTNVAKRATVAAARVLNGWTGGEPVPDGQNNTLQGEAAEWVRWVRDRFAYGLGSITQPLAGLSWLPFQQAGSTATVAVTATSTTEGLGSVLITRTGGVDPDTGAVTTVVSEGGLLAGVSVTGTGSAANGRVTVTVRDYAGNVKARYSSTTLATSFSAFALTAVDVTPEASEGQSWVTIHAAPSFSGAAETLTLTDVTLHWGDAP